MNNMIKLLTNRSVVSHLVIAGCVYFLSSEFFPQLPTRTLWPDSTSYIQNSEVRGVIYPLFLDLLISQEVQNMPHPRGEREMIERSLYFAPVSYGQWALFILACGLVMVKLESFFGVFGPTLFTLFLLGHRHIFPGDHLQWVIKDHLQDILTEGIGFSWVLLMCGFLISFCNQKFWGFKSAIIFGALSFLGVEIAGRLVALAVIFVFGVFLLALVGRRPFLHSVVISMVSILTFFGFYFGRCTYCYLKYGVFGPLPLSAWSPSAVAIQFSTKADHVLLAHDPERERFFMRVKHMAPESETRNYFVNGNLNGALETYLNMTNGDRDRPDIPAFNKFLAPIVSEVFYKNPPALMRWLKWFRSELNIMWKTRHYLHPAHFISLLLAALLILRGRSDERSLGAFALTLCLIPLANMSMTVSLMGVDPRYLSTGELVMPIVYSVFSAIFLGRLMSLTSLRSALL